VGEANNPILNSSHTAPTSSCNSTIIARTLYIFQYALRVTKCSNLFMLTLHINVQCGPGSSVGVATDYYGLDGPGSDPGGDEIFRPSRPALGPTQPPVNWVPGVSRG